MKQKYLLKLFTAAFMLMLPLGMMAQTIKGKVTDASGEALPYMNVVVKGTSNGTTTDENGEFNLEVKNLPITLVISSMGFATKQVKVSTTEYLNIVVNEDNALDEVVVTGNRTKPRTILDSPVPIDNIGVKELQASGQPTFDKMLVFKVPYSILRIKLFLMQQLITILRTLEV